MQSFPSIYIVHGVKGYEERKKKILYDFSLQELTTPFFVTEFYSEQENKTLIEKYFIKDIEQHLSKGALYCTLVHILIYEAFLKTPEKYAIIFENDVCFLNKKFKKQVLQILTEADNIAQPLLISLENSTLKFPSYFKVKKGKLLYKANFGRCAGAYIINKNAVKNILDYLQVNKCNEVIDWWHNTLVKQGVIEMFWAHPPLTEQGSFNGLLNSSISSKKQSFKQIVKWKAEKFLKTYIRRLFKDYTI